MTDDRTREALAELAGELAATEELPVERSAGRWIGEAQAVATDLAADPPDRDTVVRRLGHVLELLDNVDTTGHPAADEHVQTATSRASALLDRLG
jgi:hypothetical protein